MRLKHLIYAAFVLSSNLYAIGDIKKICPQPDKLFTQGVNDRGSFVYVGYDMYGRLLNGAPEFNHHPYGHIFVNFTVEALNLAYSQYDEATKKLKCTYNIHITDAGNGDDMGYDYAMLRSY